MAKRKKKRSKSTSKQKGKSFNPEIVRSIIQIGLWATAGLVLVSFSRQGSVLVRVNDFLVSYFGISSILLPFIFVSAGFFISKLKFILGQANVLIGSLLFFLSIAAMSRTGLFGRSAWEGIATLVTGAGAFVVLLGTTLVGIVILFNTSFDQILMILTTTLTSLREKLTGEKSAQPDGEFKDKKAGFKVYGGNQLDESSSEDKEDAKIKSVATEKKGELSQKLVSNAPGEETVWKYPPLSILNDSSGGKANRGDIKQNADTIEQTLESFGINARVVEVNQGPAVTQYAIEVALGTKLSKITALDRDLALALAAPTGTIRIEAPIPGRSLVGIELPNISPEFVPLRKMLASDIMKNDNHKLSVALGLDVAGKPVTAQISKMPHVLIAGQTGSGKSVAINTFLSSVLFRASPSEVKFILVDPKRVELTNYNDIPHLLTPVIVEPDKVISALRWLLAEMDRRYKLFAQAGARNIDSYNEMSGFQALPYIVLIIDELADIMLFSPVEVEDSITRLAQMSRATGIHMVLATQRPSVDVITGLIKANIPARIAFAVSSQVDSRVILDSQGAEKLLGKGDMLYLSPSQAKPTRIQGAFISDHETNDLVSFIKGVGVQPQYTEEVVAMPKPGTSTVPGVEGETDELFEDAIRLVCQADKASASLLQRKLSIGYARAARVLDQLEAAGVVSPQDGSKPRDVLIKSPEEVLSEA